MLCKSVYDSIERGNVTFKEADSTYCQTNQTYHWFNSTDPMPIRQLDIMKQLNSECPSFPEHGNCSCTPERLTYVENEQGTRMVYAIKVDCSNLGLTVLPKTLPETTIALNVSNNNVSCNSQINSIIIISNHKSNSYWFKQEKSIFFA